MASVNWMKATKQKAGGLKKHLGKKERVELNHSNTHINKELSHLNYSIGCSDYNEALQRMNERTKEVDAVLPPKRIRKDRVTCCFLEVPCPRKITEQGRSDEFFRNIHELYRKFFGAENVHGTMVHKDEVHEYIDAHKKVKTISLEHAHTLISAFTPSKGINGKAFETKARLNALNKAVNAMCLHTFGISFNTGEKANNEQLEVLKTKSAEVKRQQVENQVFHLQNQVVQLQNQAISYTQKPKKKITETQSAYEDRIKIQQQALAIQQRLPLLDLREAELVAKEKRLSEWEEELTVKANRLGNVMATNNQLKQENTQLKADYNVVSDMYLSEKKKTQTLTAQIKNQNAVIERMKEGMENLHYSHTGDFVSADELLAMIYPSKEQRNDFNLMM